MVAAREVQPQHFVFILPTPEMEQPSAPKDTAEAVNFFGQLLVEGNEQITDQMLDRLSRAWQATVDMHPEQRAELEVVHQIIATAQEAYHERTGRNIAGAFDLRTNHTHPR